MFARRRLLSGTIPWLRVPTNDETIDGSLIIISLNVRSQHFVLFIRNYENNLQLVISPVGRAWLGGMVPWNLFRH